MNETIESVLEFWFGRGQSATEIAEQKSPLWWSKNEQMDREITRRFTATTEAAADGKLGDWAETPRGLLALIISTDQFPRNMYRNTPAAFSRDPLALALAQTAVDSGATQRLTPIQRVFAYLPFEHSEEPPEQQRSVALYQALAASVDATETDLFNDYCEFARKHQEIIQRFGRFPHRNEILGRVSSDEEVAFLAEPGSSF